VIAPTPKRRSSDRKRVLYPLLAFLGIVAVLAFVVFRPFLAIFTVAASVALLLNPAQGRLTQLLRGRNALAAALLVIATTLLLLVPVLTTAAILSEHAVTFFAWVRPQLQPEALRDLWRDTLPQRFPWLAGFLRFDEQGASEAASAILSRLAAATNGFLQKTVAGLTEALFELVLFVMMLFFLLKDGRALRRAVEAISPLSLAQEAAVAEHLSLTVRGVFKAMILVPIVQGVVALPGLVLFGAPSPLFWSVLVFLAALVPILGSALGWVPAVVYLFCYGENWQWIGMLSWGLLLISTIDNIVKPLILGGAARIHPLTAFLSILGGLLSFGPLGFLIGPVILSLVLSAIRIYRDVLRPAVEPLPGAAPQADAESVGS
jgi:predicted PurR-regulated permease PerM